MSKAYAWRPLAIIHIIKGVSMHCNGLELYHQSMEHIIRDINELCSRDIMFSLQMTKCDTVVLFIILWSWLVPRWLLHFCDMSTNALCAHASQ
jgi:hypothetical protein